MDDSNSINDTNQSMIDGSFSIDETIKTNSSNDSDQSIIGDITINETIDESDSGVIENSRIDECQSRLTNSPFEDHSNVYEHSVEWRSNVNVLSVEEDNKANESSAPQQSQLRDANQLIDKASDDESVGELEDKIEEDDSFHATTEIIDISDSSDEISSYPKPSSSKTEFGVKFEPGVKSEKIQPTLQFERAVKFEQGVKVKPDLTFEPDVKSERDMKVETASKLNPQQLVDDVKPIHTGKTGMATFNSQQAKAVSLMENLCRSLDAKPSENDFAENPKQLKIDLMPHQKTALTWMIWREAQKPKGGILADDMGLGKTMSMISLVVKQRHDEAAQNANESSDSSDDENEDEESEGAKTSWTAKGSRSQSHYYGGTLVICPASVMDQWKNEVKNRLKSNSLTVILHHGTNRETNPRRLSKHDMVITTYGIVSSEADNGGALFSVKWERIILDEAHIIRNHTSKQSISCCKLKASARWALTGTPVQNREADLFALLKFLRCRPFDDHSSFKPHIKSDKNFKFAT